MRILLTGSSGWLGRFLAPMLEARGHVVTGLDPAPGRYTHVIGSVADRALVDRVFADHAIEAVIHGGALHKPDIERYPAQAFVDVNVTGTLNLLEAAVAAGHDRFVFTSTTSLMISQAIRDEAGDAAIWLDEMSGRSRRATSTASPSWPQRGYAASTISNMASIAWSCAPHASSRKKTTRIARSAARI